MPEPKPKTDEELDKVDKAKSNWFKTEKGKAALAKYASTDKGKDAQRRYNKSTKGKLAKSRYYFSEKGQEAHARHKEKINKFKAIAKLLELYLQDNPDRTEKDFYAELTTTGVDLGN